MAQNVHHRHIFAIFADQKCKNVAMLYILAPFLAKKPFLSDFWGRPKSLKVDFEGQNLAVLALHSIRCYICNSHNLYHVKTAIFEWLFLG